MTQEDGADDGTARFLARVESNVAEHGYNLTYVGPESTLCYTTGLWRTWGHPELLLLGLDHDDSTTIPGAYWRGFARATASSTGTSTVSSSRCRSRSSSSRRTSSTAG